LPLLEKLLEAFLVWCAEMESNHRHADFQSAALPTELPTRENVAAFLSASRGVRLALKTGGGGEDRTHDPRIKSPLLCQLSYTPDVASLPLSCCPIFRDPAASAVFGAASQLVEAEGIEPSTNGLKVRCSSG
jgi:hypothetical protein